MIAEILSTRKGKEAVLTLHCRTFHYVLLSLIEQEPINNFDMHTILGIRNNANKKRQRNKVSGLLRKFVLKEFVSRITNLDVDTRISIYSLTSKGRAYLESIRDVSEDKLMKEGFT